MKCRIYRVEEWKSWALTTYDELDNPLETEYFHYKRDAVKRAGELKRTKGIELVDD